MHRDEREARIEICCIEKKLCVHYSVLRGGEMLVSYRQRNPSRIASQINQIK